MAMLESTITAKAQTTLPKGVRAALGVMPGDRLAYIVERDRAIIMKAPEAETEESDPDVLAFLSFLQRDFRNHPENIRELPQSLFDRAHALVGDMDVDLDEPIEGEVAI